MLGGRRCDSSERYVSFVACESFHVTKEPPKKRRAPWPWLDFFLSFDIDIRQFIRSVMGTNVDLLTHSHTVLKAKRRAKKNQIESVVFDDQARLYVRTFINTEVTVLTQFPLSQVTT